MTGATSSGQVLVSLTPEEVEPFREMLRQQLLGDQELMRDAVTGRADPDSRVQVYERIRMVRRLADEVGLEQVERRHGARRGKTGRGAASSVPLAVVWIVLGILLSTAAVHTAYLLTGAEIPSLYLPWAAFATLRYGRRKGVVTVLGCAAAFLASPPYYVRPDVEGVIGFVAFLLAIWAVRRDLFD